MALWPRTFSDLNPKPLGGAAKDLIAAGKKIYEEGIPDANVPPCASCHGPEAKGAGAFPRLAGQLHDYIFNKLVNWSKERGQDPENPDTSAIMQPIAHDLTKPQIKAVAAISILWTRASEATGVNALMGSTHSHQRSRVRRFIASSQTLSRSSSNISFGSSGAVNHARNVSSPSRSPAAHPA